MHRYYNENKKIYTIVFLFNPVRFVRNEFYKDESPECIVIDDCVLNTLLYKDIFMLEKNFIENLIFNLVKTGEWVMMRERRWVVVAKVSAICRVGGLDKFWGEDEDGEDDGVGGLHAGGHNALIQPPHAGQQPAGEEAGIGQCSSPL